MIKENNLRILIVGGGIGGLSAAIALRLQGHQVEVCKPHPYFFIPSGGLTYLQIRCPISIKFKVGKGEGEGELETDLTQLSSGL